MNLNFIRKKDKRKAERFFPKLSAYIVFSPNFINRGSLINISTDGLLCLYFVDKTTQAKGIDRFVNIRAGSFTMGDIPFKIISDTKISDHSHGGQRIIRKRSIQFYNLSLTQINQIDFFLENYTKQSVANYRKKTAESLKIPFL